jgi:hypothetical protein
VIDSEIGKNDEGNAHEETCLIKKNTNTCRTLDHFLFQSISSMPGSSIFKNPGITWRRYEEVINHNL